MVRAKYDTKPLYRRFAVEWLVLLLALVIFAGILGWLWHTDRQALAKREAARLHTQATVIERNAIRQLQAADHVLQDFIGRLEGWTKYPEGMARAGEYLKVLSNAMPEISTLFFLDQNGIGRAFSENARDYLGQDFSNRPYFQPLKESSSSDSLYLSAPFVTLRDSYAMNIIRTVVGPDGKFKGIVAAGKPTVRMGMVLTMLQRLGVRVSLDLPDDALTTYEVEFDKVTRRHAQKRQTATQGGR